MRTLYYIILSVLMLAAGCATMAHGPTQEIKVTSNPPGATVTPTDYKCWAKTPGILRLDRNQGTILTARLEGYKESKIEVKWGISLWAFGNISALAYPWYISGCQPVAAAWAFDADSIGQLSPNWVHFDLEPK